MEAPTGSAQLLALRKFARSVIEDYCWGCGEPDGGDVQELATKLGLLKECVATKEDAELNPDFEEGDTIYKFADWLK